jgi:hypothetical protein
MPSELEAYNSGAPPHDAVLKFVDDEILQRAHRWTVKRRAAHGAVGTLRAIQTLRSPATLDSTKDGLAQGLGIDWRKPPKDNFCDKDPDRYQRAGRLPKRYPEFYWKKLCAILEMEIRNGKYIVLGYVSPRNFADLPRKVPKDVIQSNAHIDFGSSTIAGNGLKFIAIRLVPADLVDAEIESDRAPAPHSKKFRVIAAYDSLTASGILKSDSSPKQVKSAVKEKLGGDVTEKTIWGHLKGRHIAGRVLEKRGK